ncbi:hypothetical protein K435DRAFT_964249 [Dendrothele bispora CBS 962.96]|uniref:Uncharacterized protein n=1 Tax=Dendrothele bispora (strain CBS 962.96) TaxID=1314807 RepID=A0A4S8MBU9_DENBC|nr:hypothetical protein K435DRAFT_964249 [Dendrothele bispora CBS 962.96]
MTSFQDSNRGYDHMYDEYYPSHVTRSSDTGPGSMPSTHARLDDFGYSNNYQGGDGFDFTTGHGDNVYTSGNPNLGPSLGPRTGLGWGETDAPFHAGMPSALSNPYIGQDSSFSNDMVIPPQYMDIASAIPTTPQLPYTQTSPLIPPGTPGFFRGSWTFPDLLPPTDILVQGKERSSGINQYHHVESTGRSHEKFCDGPQLEFSPDRYSLLALSTDDGSSQPLFNQDIQAANGDTGDIQDHSMNKNEYMPSSSVHIESSQAHDSNIDSAVQAQGLRLGQDHFPALFARKILRPVTT